MDRLNRGSSPVCRVAMKLLSLQKVCQMDVVFLKHITAAFLRGGGANVRFDREEVTQTLNRMFHQASQEASGHPPAVEQMCSLVFQLFDRSQFDSVSADSVQTLLIVLSAETLLTKYTALLDLSGDGSGSISRSGLTSLLDHLIQVPAAVQESGASGDVDAAVMTCFTGVWTPTVTKEHVLSWLQSEPPLLLWFPTLHRLFISQSIRHNVCCHTCKSTPIIGLRYRCMRCVNVHVCQSCFLSDKHTRKHKIHHPVLEFCTQPTWRESLLSLVHRTRHALFPHQDVQREADRRLLRDISHDALSSPKSLQTEKPQHEQVMILLNDVRNLQRDKRALKQQLQDWKQIVQSEHRFLEDRYAGMEVTMETLRKHNMCLQDMLTQALHKMESGQPHMSQCVTMETEKITPTSDTETCTDSEEDEQVLKKEDEVEREEELNQFPTASAHDIQFEEEVDSAAEALCQQAHDSGEARSSEDKASSSGDSCAASSPERKLQESVERLKTLMETGMWREKQTSDKRWTEFLANAAQVEESIHHLVDAVRITSGGGTSSSHQSP